MYRRCIAGSIVAVLSASAAVADHAPTMLLNGAVVYGEWGLYRPGHVTPVVEGPWVVPAPRAGGGYYFPSNRSDPGAYQRRPAVGAAAPTDPYFRFWGAESQPSPPTVQAPYDPPTIIYAPPERHRKKK